ncbi:MAG: ROK family protein [Clostridia bacterium]|nr:ROK family protein [Clostridia bacterium]
MKKYINQMDMKQANAADIFALIRKSRRITRKEIEAKTGFSWGAVSTIASLLIEKNYIRELKCEQPKGAGRAPSYLEVNTTDHFVLGVDINISGFKSVLVNLQNEIVGNNFYKATYSDKDSLLSEIIKFIKETMTLADSKNIIGIGVAMQGLVDAKNGISVSIPHCKDWSNVPLSYIISKEFDLPVFIEHDPDCILYAVSTEQIYKNAILLRVDKGIGMSVLSGGKIFGKPGMFEIGHTIAVPNGMLCSCGKQGCLEAYASMSGMATLAGCRFDELVQKVKSGDKKSQEIFYDMAKYLAVALLNASHMLCISRIVLCGDMWQYKDLFYDAFLNSLKEIDSKNSLEFSFIDVENAATGAALIAIEHAIKYIDFRKEDES